MSDVLINVLLPTYEPDAAHLQQSLDSLLRQSETKWTCLISDDASVFDTESAVRPYLSDPRIRFRRNERRLGLGGNWNQCLAEIDAPFVQFLFQDDMWHPEYLAQASAVLQRYPTVGLVGAEHAYLCDEGMETAQGYARLREAKRLIAPGMHDGRSFLHEWVKGGLERNLIGEPCFVMLRASDIQRAGSFSQELKQMLDVEFWVRLLLFTDWYYLPRELGIFRVHRKGATFQNYESGVSMQDYFLTLEKVSQLFPRGSEEREILSSHLDHSFTFVISHILNRVIRWKSIGIGAAPYITYMRYHPTVALKAFGRYLVQASIRWTQKCIRWM